MDLICTNMFWLMMRTENYVVIKKKLHISNQLKVTYIPWTNTGNITEGQFWNIFVNLELINELK